jgi:N4-gp56 family major capsid protein
MSSFTGTTHDRYIPEQWSDEMRVAAENRLVMAKSVKSVPHDKKTKGDVVHIPDVSNVDAADLGEGDDDIAGMSVTEGEFTLTINKKKHITFYIPKHLGNQLSKYEFRSPYTKKIGYGLGKAMDSDLFALWPSLTNKVGSTADGLEGNISDPMLLKCIEYLDTEDADEDGRVLILPARQKSKILGIDKFIRADAVGDSNQKIVKAKFGEIYDANVLFTNNTPTKALATAPATVADSLIGFYMQKDCLAIALPQDVETDYAWLPQKKAWILSGDCLYGVAVYKDKFGVVVVTQKVG